MAEITKVTTPMMPKENTSIKHKPLTDHAFELSDPNKVHKQENEGRLTDRQPDASTILRESMGRSAVAPLLKNPGEMLQAFKKIALLIEMGVSASDATKDAATKELLDSLFVSPKQVLGVLSEQDKSSVLFKGEAFDILRDILGKFEDSPKIKDSIVNLLKIFEQNVNTQNSVKSILQNATNLLDYMFSKDKAQFTNYIKDLANMLLPKSEAESFIAKMPVPPQPQQTAQTGQTPMPQQAGQAPQTQGQEQPVQQTPGQAGDAQAAAKSGEAQNPQNTQNPQNPATAQNAENRPAGAAPELPEQAKNTQQPANPNQTQDAGQNQAQQSKQADQPLDPFNRALNTEKFGQELHQTANKNAEQSGIKSDDQQLSQKDTAQILKNNLLPLLSEIVVKYNQSDKIRDIVMVIVHNLVRVDKGTPESLNDAVNKLMNELKDVANVPKGFEKQFLDTIMQSASEAKSQPNSVISKLSDIVSEALRSPDTNPAVLRQAENMLVSMLQNQSAIMDVLHFILPFQTPLGQVFTELYVDPETEEKAGKQKEGQSRKIFLSVETEAHGSFELSFLETNEHVDFNIWAPEDLVQQLSGLKRNFGDIMLLHGYTMSSFKVQEMKAPHSVAEVFPRLIEKKVGIDFNV